jgi:spore germination protein YaaH
MESIAIRRSTYTEHAALLAVIFAAVGLLFPAGSVSARTNLEVAGWVPYWQSEEGIESADDNLRNLDTIHPFVYEVQIDGSVNDMGDIDSDDWDDLFDSAKRRNVEIIPTLTWFDGDAIHHVLSDDDLRDEHIEEIVDLVEDNDFDGIDIDYEGKLAGTIDYYSEFLEELEDELGSKVLTCTIEARTPPESKWRVVPNDIEYANDLREIGRHCDRVEIMAYDQQRIDWRLNTEKSGAPYIPVADTDWVEKVLELALEDIDEDKIMLGVPTYGREWTLTVEPDWYKDYMSVGAINMPDALAIADEYEVTPGRNQAGEMSFTYFPEESIFSILEVLPVPEGTQRGNEAAAQALLFATATGMTVPVNVVWYSDVGAIEEKIALAKKHDLRGISIFKIDGEEDEDIWDLF